MKKIMILAMALILGLLVSQVSAQVVVVEPGVRVQVQVPQVEPGPSVVVVPPGYARVAPQYVAPVGPPPVPPKPQFWTPVRNGLWWAGVGVNRAVWHNRYWRYNRLGHLLGPSVIVQPNNPYCPKQQQQQQ